MKILIVYYSLFGHVHALAEAAAEGVNTVDGTEAVLRRIPETLTPEIIKKMGAEEAQKKMASTPVCTIDELGEVDAIIFGTPTRFGNMCGQMKQFLDAVGQLWVRGALIGKPGAFIASSNTQHGGQESTILTAHVTLLHLGMIVVGLPYSFTEQSLTEQISGCSPYGASTIAGGDGSRMPSSIEVSGARYQGRYIAEIANKLAPH